jgi:hypothetical protein
VTRRRELDLAENEDTRVATDLLEQFRRLSFHLLDFVSLGAMFLLDDFGFRHDSLLSHDRAVTRRLSALVEARNTAHRLVTISEFAFGHGD